MKRTTKKPYAKHVEKELCMSDQKRDPAFLLSGRFLIGTMDMTDEEVGIYTGFYADNTRRETSLLTQKLTGV
ncbi:MAG: hypothetical protein ACLRYB_18320 [Segatella copri]